MEATPAEVHQVKVSQDDEFIPYARLGKVGMKLELV